jgi:hypothetical protein
MEALHVLLKALRVSKTNRVFARVGTEVFQTRFFNLSDIRVSRSGIKLKTDHLIICDRDTGRAKSNIKLSETGVITISTVLRFVYVKAIIGEMPVVPTYVKHGVRVFRFVPGNQASVFKTNMILSMFLLLIIADDVYLDVLDQNFADMMCNVLSNLPAKSDGHLSDYEDAALKLMPLVLKFVGQLLVDDTIKNGADAGLWGTAGTQRMPKLYFLIKLAAAWGEVDDKHEEDREELLKKQCAALRAFVYRYASHGTMSRVQFIEDFKTVEGLLKARDVYESKDPTSLYEMSELSDPKYQDPAQLKAFPSFVAKLSPKGPSKLPPIKPKGSVFIQTRGAI